MPKSSPDTLPETSLQQGSQEYFSRDLALADVGLNNESCTSRQKHHIQQSLAKARAAVELLENDIQKAMENKKIILEDIERYKAALAPHKIIPESVICYIFDLLAEAHGAVHIPYSKETPPQIIVSHVCRGWRRIALSMVELWNSIILDKDIFEGNKERLYRRWLSRAGNRSITLSIVWGSNNNMQTIALIHNLSLRSHIKTLRLELSCEQFAFLRKIPGTLASIEELELLFVDQDLSLENPFDALPQWVDRTRKLTFDELIIGREPPFFHSDLAFPWSQLRCFKCAFDMELSTAIKILQQMHVLEELRLCMQNKSEAKVNQPIVMPRLRDLTVQIFVDIRGIFSLIKCPNVVSLNFETTDEWGIDTYATLKDNYNFQRLEELDLSHGCLPLSLILRDAPMLRKITVPNDVVVDDEAIAGMAQGSLGRCLTSIIFDCTCYVEEILAMLAIRHRNIQMVMEKGCTWKEEIWPVKKVGFTEFDANQKYKGQVDMLKEIGTEIIFGDDVGSDEE